MSYIPVDVDLNSLRAQYDWAEENTEKVKRIVENANKFAEYLLSSEYMKSIYQELFVDYFGKLIQAYKQQNRSWKECLELYNKMGLQLREVAHCDDASCFIEWEEGLTYQISKHIKLQ